MAATRRFACLPMIRTEKTIKKYKIAARMSVIIILLPPLQGLFHPSKGGKEMKKQHMDHSMRPHSKFCTDWQYAIHAFHSVAYKAFIFRL